MYRLLLVDDEPIILNSYFEMLSEAFKNELNVDNVNTRLKSRKNSRNVSISS